MQGKKPEMLTGKCGHLREHSIPKRKWVFKQKD